MDYKELPDRIKELKRHNDDRRRAINECDRPTSKEWMVVQIEGNYVRVSAEHLKAAIAKTTEEVDAELVKLTDVHDTLEKVAKGLL
ncbi:hypothetical protein Erwinia_phage_Aioli_00009 [Erwinia phage Aioli]|nr:hypothetical protein Erwinia_phage_Aioli_00009 [Erwinia phage Aioli]